MAGHIAVARRLRSDEPAFWLGSALPDVASMGRFRLLGSTDHDGVQAGIAFHHRTDEAFHHHRWFRDLQTELGTALRADDFAAGPTRAVAHVGPELMLDGWVLANEGDPVDAALALIDDFAPELASLVRPPERERWLTHLARVATWRPHDDGHDADAVAVRLHRILSRRPRLSFHHDLTTTVAGHLRVVEPRIGATTEDLVDDLAAKLRSETTRP